MPTNMKAVNKNIKSNGRDESNGRDKSNDKVNKDHTSSGNHKDGPKTNACRDEPTTPPRRPQTKALEKMVVKFNRIGPKGKNALEIRRGAGTSKVPSKTGECTDSADAEKPELKIDKLTLAVLMADLSTDERAVVNNQLKSWFKRGILKRGSTKGRGFKNAYVRSFKDGFTIEIRVNPSRAELAKQFMSFTLNPQRITDTHAAGLQTMFANLFPGRSREMILRLRLYRIDVCADFPVDVNSLIVRQRRAKVESKFFVATDSAGLIQTIYLGSIASDVHGAIYDQNASDEYKRAVGEPTGLPPLERVRSSSKDDAEVLIQRTRFEVRRVFKDLPQLDVLEKWTAPFDRWDVWRIKDIPPLRKDPAFWMYLDVVKWRGVAGARIYLTARGCTELTRFEKTLEKFKIDWWEPNAMSLHMQSACRSPKLWGLLQG